MNIGFHDAAKNQDSKQSTGRKKYPRGKKMCVTEKAHDQTVSAKNDFASIFACGLLAAESPVRHGVIA
jgi:hypothetical protein